MAASILFMVPPAEGALMRGSSARTVPRRRSPSSQSRSADMWAASTRQRHLCDGVASAARVACELGTHDVPAAPVLVSRGRDCPG